MARDGAGDGASRASARAYVFDLDGTLYAIANGYEAACRRRRGGARRVGKMVQEV